MRTIKRIGSLLLVAVMTLSFMPLMSMEAKAGDGFSVPFIGLNSDGTVDPGTTIKVAKSDLNTGCDYNWAIADTIDWKNSKSVTTYEKDGYICMDVTLNHMGKWLTFYRDGKDTGIANGNTSPIEVSGTCSIKSGPTLSTNYYITKKHLKADLKFFVSGQMELQFPKSGNKHYITEKYLKLFRNGKLYTTKKVTDYSSYVEVNGVPLSYSTKDNFEVKLAVKIGLVEKEGASMYLSAQSLKLTKPSLRVTKISKKNAHLVWGKVAGATHYWVYKGSKKIKELKGKTAYTVKGKKAGTSKYRVQAVIKSGKKAYKSAFSKLVKPAANVIKFNRSVNYSSTSYATCPFRITKISLSGKTYTVTGYAVNNRIFKMVKYKNLTAGLRVGGKKAFSKKYKNYRVNCKPSSSKKIVLKIKGKAGVDLRNGTITYTEGGTPVWK